MTRPPLSWCAALCFSVVLGCPSKKQVPFGLEDAGVEDADDAGETLSSSGDGAVLPPAAKAFEAGRVEVSVGERTMVLEQGYALSALPIELDDDEAVDVLVVAADGHEVALIAGYPRGSTVASKRIDAFLVPDDCSDPSASIAALSEGLVHVEVTHACAHGARANHWLVSVETQPRVKERITILPSPADTTSIELAFRAEDLDSDGYEDVVADLRVDETQVPVRWLNRPGGFARDRAEPESTLRSIVEQASPLLVSKPNEAGALALEVLDVFRILCRESGEARVGLSGTQGLLCGRSPATATAIGIASASAMRRGDAIQSLQLRRAWERPSTSPTPADRKLLDGMLLRSDSTNAAEWQLLDREASAVPIHFEDADTLIIGGRKPRSIRLSTLERSSLAASELKPAIVDPTGRFTVSGVRATCAGFEAEVTPVGSKRTHRIPIDRSRAGTPCKSPVDRPASVLEWVVLGWAPQGLVVASADRLRIVPIGPAGKPAGSPVDLEAGSPLPAPIRGPGITPDGARYAIPHAEGIVVRDWKTGATGLWLRPKDWDGVPGPVRSIAISPDGQRIAVQKGTEIRLMSW